MILKLDGSPYDYLVDKYTTVDELFGLKDKIRINDFVAVYTAIKKQEQWEELENLGKLAKVHHPETLLGNYYLALFYEQTGHPKKALRLYQSCLLYTSPSPRDRG